MPRTDPLKDDQLAAGPSGLQREPPPRTCWLGARAHDPKTAGAWWRAALNCGVEGLLWRSPIGWFGSSAAGLFTTRRASRQNADARSQRSTVPKRFAAKAREDVAPRRSLQRGRLPADGARTARKKSRANPPYPSAAASGGGSAGYRQLADHAPPATPRIRRRSGSTRASPRHRPGRVDRE